MRNKFDSQLTRLNNELISMGEHCEDAISNAIKALCKNSKEYAKAAVESDRIIDKKEKSIETLCLKLILKQQPVARDLRAISSALKMITDMERIGDQAADIAELATYCNLSANWNMSHIQEMSKEVIKMVSDSVNAFVNKDLTLAKSVIEYDDVVDKSFYAVRSAVISLISENPANGEIAVDILMIAKYLERIGDHATNIAEWVVFSITGSHVL